VQVIKTDPTPLRASFSDVCCSKDVKQCRSNQFFTISHGDLNGSLFLLLLVVSKDVKQCRSNQFISISHGDLNGSLRLLLLVVSSD